MKKIFSVILWVCLSVTVFSQGNDIVKIILDANKSDAFRIGEQKISRAHVYGTEENIIKFLISDKYVDHNMNRGVVYNFIFADNAYIPADYNPQELQEDTNKILIYTSDSATYRSIFIKSDQPAENSKKNTFQLGEVNNLRVFVTDKMGDTNIFDGTKEIVHITLEEEKSDIFQINGTTIPKVVIYGTKENIIRFLINDKFIKHKMEESGSSYNFLYTDEYANQFKNSPDATKKLIIVIEDPNEFMMVYNNRLDKDPNNLSFKLTDITDLSIVVLNPEKTSPKRK